MWKTEEQPETNAAEVEAPNLRTHPPNYPEHYRGRARQQGKKQFYLRSVDPCKVVVLKSRFGDNLGTTEFRRFAPKSELQH